MQDVRETLAEPPPIAGIDTTTGYAVDSLFSDSQIGDPWAGRCLANVVDTVINHADPVFPSPSLTLIQTPEDLYLPLSFVELRKRGLIRITAETSADEVALDSELVRREYLNFVEWTKAHITAVAAWANYHKTSPRITASHHIVVPRHLVDEFWRGRDDNSLSAQVGIPDEHLAYAFDTFIRAIQYHRILGPKTPYFAHPIRDRALRTEAKVFELTPQWSWGRYLLALTERHEPSHDLNWILDRLARLKESTSKYNATWYRLGALSSEERVDALSTIAAESDLPATVTASTIKAIKTSLGIGAAVTSLGIPVVSVILTLCLTGLERWSGAVPGRLGRFGFIRGHLVWPGLPS